MVKTDDTLLFLDSLIYRHNIEAEEMKSKIVMFEAIRSVIGKKAEAQKIPLDDYRKLKELSCPPKALLTLFSDNMAFDAMGMPIFPDEESLLEGCSSTNCIRCWQSFIAELIDSVNNSEIHIKLPPDHEGDQS